MRALLGRLKNMLMIGYLAQTIDDSQDRQIATVVTHSKQYPALNISPYGLFANAPPLKSHVVTFNLSSASRNMASMCFLQKERFKNLNPGEVAIANIESGNYAYFKKDGILIEALNGNVTIKNGNATLVLKPDKLVCSVPIEAPDYQGSGGSAANLTKGANTGQGDMVSQGINLSVHHHGGVKSGSDISGGPAS